MGTSLHRTPPAPASGLFRHLTAANAEFDFKRGANSPKYGLIYSLLLRRQRLVKWRTPSSWTTPLTMFIVFVVRSGNFSGSQLPVATCGTHSDYDESARFHKFERPPVSDSRRLGPSDTADRRIRVAGVPARREGLDEARKRIEERSRLMFGVGGQWIVPAYDATAGERASFGTQLAPPSSPRTPIRHAQPLSASALEKLHRALVFLRRRARLFRGCGGVRSWRPSCGYKSDSPQI
jgi:hypothetical protein